MNPVLILLCIGLAIPALYLLLTRRATHRGGDLRTDANERPELTGSVQRKERPYEHDV